MRLGAATRHPCVVDGSFDGTAKFSGAFEIALDGRRPGPVVKLLGLVLAVHFSADPFAAVLRRIDSLRLGQTLHHQPPADDAPPPPDIHPLLAAARHPP